MKILEYTYEQFKDEIKKIYKRDRFLAASVYREVFRNCNTDFSNITDIKRAPDLIFGLKENLKLNLLPVIDEKREDNLIKFVTRLFDNNVIESVIIPMFTHNTLCISTQVGCRMGCKFCETAKTGFIRNLTVEEIIGQVFSARINYKVDIRNIVFMGMGEPFDNYNNVIHALRILNDPRGLDMPFPRITVSTSGDIEGIKKLRELNWPQLNLAVSLNASNDHVRSSIMPMNRKYKMADLKDTLLKHPLRKSGTVFIEYVLIKGVNDLKEHAKELVEFLKPLSFQINLIPLNSNSIIGYKAPLEEEVEKFRNYLIEEKVFIRRRITRGKSIMAACGQLSSSNNK